MGSVLAILVWGFFVGSLARWAVPGPDPMPIWLTMVIGVMGAVVGGGVTAAIVGTKDVSPNEYFAISIASILAAALLVVAYRRLIQKRPITGPEARKLPTRGIGVARMRDRLRKMGIDPDRFHEPGHVRQAPGRTEDALTKLRDLRDEGVLTQEEYDEKKAEIEKRGSV